MISRREQHRTSTFVIVSDIGADHQKKNTPNQDAANFVIADDDFVLVVSDGVGSCPKAEIGSKAAVSAVENIFAGIKKKRLRIDLPAIADQIIVEWYKLLGPEAPDDCCATLKAAMKFGNRLLLFSIGDGLLAVTSGGMSACSPMENNLFTNQTMCLNAAAKVTDFWTLEFVLDTYIPFAILACSDGVANGIQEGREMDLVREIETGISSSELQGELEALLVDLAEFSFDDKTVGVVKYEHKNAKSVR